MTGYRIYCFEALYVGNLSYTADPWQRVGHTSMLWESGCILSFHEIPPPKGWDHSSPFPTWLIFAAPTVLKPYYLDHYPPFTMQFRASVQARMLNDALKNTSWLMQIIVINNWVFFHLTYKNLEQFVWYKCSEVYLCLRLLYII